MSRKGRAHRIMVRLSDEEAAEVEAAAERCFLSSAALIRFAVLRLIRNDDPEALLIRAAKNFEDAAKNPNSVAAVMRRK